MDLATNDLPPISPLPSPESPIIDDDGSLYPGDLSLSGTAIIEAERDDGEQEEQDASLMNQGAANAVVEDEPAVLDARRIESTSTSAHARVDSREAAPVQPSRTLSSLEFFQFDLGFVRPAPVNEDDAWTTTDEGTPESGLNIIEVPRPRLSFPAGPALRTPSALLGPITTEAIGETNDTGVRNRSGRIPYVVIWEDVMDPSVDAARLPLRSELEEASYAFPRLAQPAPATTPTQSASAPSPTQPVAVGTVAPVYPHSEITWPAEASSPAPEASSISAAPEPSPATASPAIEAAASAESVQAQVEAGIIDDATLSWLFSRIRRAAQENDGDYEELVSARLRELLRRGAAMTTSPVPVASDEAVQDQLEDGVINDATLEFLYAQIRAVALASNGDYTQLVSARLRLLEDRGTRLVRRNAVTDD